MNPVIATLLFSCGIAGLFYLDRDKRVRTSKALWLPVIYIWIVGSRAVSQWLGFTPPSGSNTQLEGSPIDAAIFGILLIAALGTLFRRASKVRILLAANWPILVYFVYCLISVAWSDHPDVSFKRWIKAWLDLVMGLIVVTDDQPVEAFKRLISRIGFVLLPASLLLIKYYGDLGRNYTPDGFVENTGVTTNKNMLGVLLLVVSLGTLWRVMTLFREKSRADRKRRLLAHCVLLAFAIVLLRMAHSATAIASLILGGGLILATSLRAIRGRPSRVHALCLTIILAGGLLFFFNGQRGVANALGRNSNLSGRTEIWSVLIPTVPSAIVGAGFESYWISPSVAKVWGALSRAGWWRPEVLVTEAHNGYIEVYLNLGWVGVTLIAAILISGYRRAVSAFQRYPTFASLTLAYIVAAAVYSITEAGFRMLDPMWIFLLLAVVSSSGIMVGVIRPEAVKEVASARARSASAGDRLGSGDEPISSLSGNSTLLRSLAVTITDNPSEHQLVKSSGN